MQKTNDGVPNAGGWKPRWTGLSDSFARTGRPGQTGRWRLQANRAQQTDLTRGAATFWANSRIQLMGQPRGRPPPQQSAMLGYPYVQKTRYHARCSRRHSGRNAFDRRGGLVGAWRAWTEKQQWNTVHHHPVYAGAGARTSCPVLPDLSVPFSRVIARDFVVDAEDFLGDGRRLLRRHGRELEGMVLVGLVGRNRENRPQGLETLMREGGK